MKTRAFTLIELLTVIAILAVLAALLLASLSGAKAQATATACRNNLDQIAKAMANYTADFSKYPGTRAAPIWPPRNLDAHWEQIWDHRLLPYVSGDRAVFVCPADPTPHIEPPFALTNYSYGYNAYGTEPLQLHDLNLGLGRARVPEIDFSMPLLEISESQVKAPADMLTIGDLNDLQNVFTTTIEPTCPPPYAGGPANRHNSGANMVFCDGHAEFAKQNAWMEETDTARRRWNNDHEPHPETW
jgi:prepilin-type processing-associated H-X9-DG protein/prepilin-type N-terminal cleavage/methylation domain-containing protein